MKTAQSAHDWLGHVLDPGWVERDAMLASADPLAFPGYAPRAESVLAGSGTIGEVPVEAVSFDFGVLGGSMGVVAGEKVARAFDRAVERRAAVVALTATGGARMQEGMLALVQMAKTVAARDALRRAGLPFLAYLRHPTTGGVYASFASLADLIWAEPGATIGFAGPRVAEAVTGRPLPDGSHTAEFAAAHGSIDGIVPTGDLPALLRRTLDLLLGRDQAEGSAAPPEPSAPDDTSSAWDHVRAARDPKRPTGAGLLMRIAPGRVEMRGDRAGGVDPGVVTAFARIAGVRMLAVALNRTHPTPAGFRTTCRALSIATTLRLPVMTLIDTPGADPSSESEGDGIASAIAQTFHAMLTHPAPTVAVVTGEGGSGGALAFAAADRILILQHAIFSVIGPEAAATILRRTDIEQVAVDLHLTAFDLRAFEIADRIVAEPRGSAAHDPAATAEAVEHAVGLMLSQIGAAAPTEARAARWRATGARFVLDPSS